MLDQKQILFECCLTTSTPVEILTDAPKSRELFMIEGARLHSPNLTPRKLSLFKFSGNENNVDERRRVKGQKQTNNTGGKVYPHNWSTSSASASDKQLAAPPVDTVGNCLICRNEDCRGNLYCSLLLPKNNHGELVTLNRRKSVIQNRRKSALPGDELEVAVNESGGQCGANKNGGDSGKCSESKNSLSADLKYTKRTARDIAPDETCRLRIPYLFQDPSKDNDTTYPTRRADYSCESVDRARNYERESRGKSEVSSSNNDGRSCRGCCFFASIAATCPSEDSRTSKKLAEGSVTMAPTTNPIDAESRGRTSSCDNRAHLLRSRPKTRFRSRALQPPSAPFSTLNCILWLIGSALLVNFTMSLLVSAAYTNISAGSTGVCTSTDIRNKAPNLHNLTGCRVIEGFLVITLMEESNQTDFENYSFPELTEITDFLLIYRVNGLRSLAKLFPNLQVIRGNTLFEGFAVVIRENAKFEEISLPSLVTINRGGVRIEKNPVLCFAHTIDWNRIAMNATPETLIVKGNKATKECPLCGPGRIKGDVSNGECPLVSGTKRYCWNQDHCQKICPEECGNRACNSQGKCCNETCLGSCSEDGGTCTVCRNLVAYDKYGDKMCVKECPANTYKHMNRRCLTRTECLQVSKPPRSDWDTFPYIPFEGECLLNCKPGYERVGDTCVQCHNKCAITCNGKQILNINDAEKLRGCTIIKENLMINIRQGGPHLIEDLENALSSIEEIVGYLKITRTYSIVSLSFFRRLRVIRGEQLVDSKYAFYVLDNQNLQSLWGDNQNVTIDHGRIFFHFNPKLCYNKIEALKPFIKENNTFDVAEVAQDSNGDRVACDIRILRISNILPSETAAMVSVQPIEFEDERVFLGYQFFYMEAPYQNVSIYENRHGCGFDSWDVDDDNNKDHQHLFTHLKPYTQYAFYVKTSTIASEKKGGQSKIHYFRTLPSTPDPVRNLEFTVLNYSSIEIRWIEPREPKGNLTEYHLSAEITDENRNILEQRNFCTERAHSFLPAIKENREHIPEEPKKTAIASEESCRSICKDLERHVSVKTLDEPPARENEIDFEDAIMNFVYVKRPTDSQQRQKRSVRSTDTFTDTLPQRSMDEDIDIPNVEELRKVESNGWYTTYGESVNATTKYFIFTGLKHYSRYNIFVRACREGTGKRCSMKTRIYPRTARKDGADDIQNLTAHIENINNTRNNVRLMWKEPFNPNGLIVSYSIKYYRVDIEHAKHVDKCISHREFENSTKGYILFDMDSGNYSVQVMATSLAGDGNYSKPVYFYIKESRLSWQAITMICVGFLVLCIIIAYIIWHFRRRCLPPPDDLKLFTSVNPEYISMQYTPDEWEIPRENIIQLRELGQGSFGMVYEGIVKNLHKDGEDIPCAIKTVNENATDRERINFLNEASVMKAFDTFHVVRLLGVVSRDQPTLVIMELMTNGDLKAYLRSNRPDLEPAKLGELQGQPPTLKRILQMAIEIADGMAYLSAKKFVHRDLAARNCMVAEDLTVKIGDFGMTRDIYETDYYRKGTKGLLPVRWMAPESLKDGVFSSSSDVFSYGVVLWEMATLASQPYQGLSNDQVLRYVIDGGVMERPENCPDKLYDLMRRCWQHRPSARPSFMEIIDNLLNDAETNFNQVSFFNTDEGQEIYRQMQQTAVQDPDDTTPLREAEFNNHERGENYLTDPTNSQRQRSPYSLGSGIATNSIMEGTSRQSNENSSQLTITTNNKNKDAAPATTAATVQSFSNSLVPPRIRRIWRNAFLGNGNSNYSNRSCNGAGGAAVAIPGLEVGSLSGVEAGVRVPGVANKSGGNGSNSGSGIASGLGGIFSGLVGFGNNNESGSGSNSRFGGKDNPLKSNQKLSQETITNPLLNDTSFDDITPPQLSEANEKPNSKVQCNHDDHNVNSSSRSNSNKLNQLSSPYHQRNQQLAQTDSQNERQWLHSNGFVPTSNPSAPLLPPNPLYQLNPGGSNSNVRGYASRFSPHLKKSSRPTGLGDNLIPKPIDNFGSSYQKLLPSPTVMPAEQLLPQPKSDFNQHKISNEVGFDVTQFVGDNSKPRRRSPPSTST